MLWERTTKANRSCCLYDVPINYSLVPRPYPVFQCCTLFNIEKLGRAWERGYLSTTVKPIVSFAFYHTHNDIVATHSCSKLYCWLKTTPSSMWVPSASIWNLKLKVWLVIKGKCPEYYCWETEDKAEAVQTLYSETISTELLYSIYYGSNLSFLGQQNWIP